MRNYLYLFACAYM